ncbi:MAG: serine/threonine protein kinase [Planctomycetaceae bacterium]|nr:serine/threonine protein kinase [Planctomycetaceae bacterium]
MTDQERQAQTHVVDQLDQKALFNLALEARNGTEPRRAYAVPSQDELAPFFPDFELQELIGVGGMGCVFRARQMRLDRMVAIKILPRELAADALFAERFSREARAMARLNHPNIVRVYDYGKTGDVYFLIMEYMDGMNLRELIDAGAIPATEACRIFEQVCGALQYAHAEGVVHRDIKPENILFSRLGHVALADFGLARLAIDSNVEISLTQTRQAMGTLNYMAPEQWENPRAVDHRADIYALGVLLYELLTGKVPRGRFSPASALADVPTTVDDVIHQALQVEPSDRFASVQQLCDSLTAAADGSIRPRPFADNGTFTRLVNLGAGAFGRIAPSSRVLSSSDRAEVRRHRVAMVMSLLAFFSTGILMAMPWAVLDGRNTVTGISSFTRIEDILVPNFVILIAVGMTVVLALFRRQVHPFRADVLSVGFNILVFVMFVFMFDGPRGGFMDPRRTPSAPVDVTVVPFILIGIIALQTAETALRILAYLLRPIGWFCNWFGQTCRGWHKHWADEEQLRRERWRQRWRQRWGEVKDTLREMSRK